MKKHGSTHLDVDTQVIARLLLVEQRYTPRRRKIVDALARAGHPLTIQEILDHSKDLAQSSVYRNLVVLEQSRVVSKVITNGEHGRYELAEDLTGHHHHLMCSQCGVVRDVVVPEALEHEIDRSLATLARREGFLLDHHRLDVIGRCSKCR